MLTHLRVAALALGLGVLVGLALRAAEPPLYRADFVVAQEPPYGGGGDGIQFFALQRVESKAVDRAVLSIDADLPLAVALRAAKGKRLSLTLETHAPPQRLERDR